MLKRLLGYCNVLRGHSITRWTRWGGGGGQKMSVFVHAQGIKTVHAGGGVKKCQNSVHVVVEWPLSFDAQPKI